MLEVHIEKGMQNGQKITFQGEADEAVWCHFSSIDWLHWSTKVLKYTETYLLFVWYIPDCVLWSTIA
jgi:hypothetical protein